jgi:hypothetical protein
MRISLSRPGWCFHRPESMAESGNCVDLICHFFLDEKVTKKSSRFANLPAAQPGSETFVSALSSHILPRHRAGKIPVRSKSAGLPARPWTEILPQHRFADSGISDFVCTPRLVFSPTCYMVCRRQPQQGPKNGKSTSENGNPVFRIWKISYFFRNSRFPNLEKYRQKWEHPLPSIGFNCRKTRT